MLLALATTAGASGGTLQNGRIAYSELRPGIPQERSSSQLEINVRP